MTCRRRGSEAHRSTSNLPMMSSHRPMRVSDVSLRGAEPSNSQRQAEAVPTGPFKAEERRPYRGSIHPLHRLKERRLRVTRPAASNARRCLRTPISLLSRDVTEARGAAFIGGMGCLVRQRPFVMGRVRRRVCAGSGCAGLGLGGGGARWTSAGCRCWRAA